MKKIGIISLLIIIITIIAAFFIVKNDSNSTLAGPKIAAKLIDGKIMIADFENPEAVNNLGEKYGTWDKDSQDATQGCVKEIAAPGAADAGSCLKLFYDVDSPNPAYNGFYMLLGGLDASKMSAFSFMVKGDTKGFPKEFKIELKDSKASSPYIVQLNGKNWQEVEIPLSNFMLLSEPDKLKEFVIVFEDSKSVPKTGVIYIDNICLKQ